MSSLRVARWLTAGLFITLLVACGNGRPTPGEEDDPNAATTFAKSFGGELDDFALAAIETADGGYAFVGIYGEEPDDGNPDTLSTRPLWLTRLDSNGNVSWQSTIGEGALGGVLGRRPFNLVIAAAPGGDFCVAGGVQGVEGDLSDLFVARLDAQGTPRWEHRFDSGGWNGYEIIASGDRGPFAHDRPTAVEPGPNGSCYVAGLSFAHLRDSFGIGIRSSDGVVLVDGGSYLDARSLVVARVNQSGLDWLRRDTEGAFDSVDIASRDGLFVERGDDDVDPQRIALRALSDGSVALATSRRYRTTTANFGTQLVELSVYDSAGTPDPVFSVRRGSGSIVPAVDEIGGDFILAESPHMGGGDATVTRVRRDGSVRWESEVLGSGEVSSLHVYLDASGPRIAMFGGSNNQSRIQILNADAGTTLTTHTVSNTGPWEHAAPLAVPGRFLAARRVPDGPDVLQELDLFVPDPLVVETAIEFGDSPIRVASRFAYQASTTLLTVFQSEGTANQIRLTPGTSLPIGLVELANDQFGIAVQRGGEADGDGYIVVGADGLTSSTALAIDGSAANVGAIAPGRNSGAALLLRFSDPSIADEDAFAVVELGSDGEVRARSDLFSRRGAGPAVLRSVGSGGYAILERYVRGRITQNSESRVIRIGVDGTVVDDFAVPGTWWGFDVASDGGYMLSGFGPNGNVLFALLRLSQNGDVVWHLNYALPGARRAQANAIGGVYVPVRASVDGSYVVATTTRGLVDSGYAITGSNSFPRAETNISVIRVAADGTPEWLRVHGARQMEFLTGLTTTGDGGYLLSAGSDSLAQPTPLANRIPMEAWLLRLGSDGRVTESCNAYLGSIPGEFFVVGNGGLPVSPARMEISAGELVSSRVSTSAYGQLVVASPPVVEARQCVGLAASGTGSGEPAPVRTLTVNQAGSQPGLVTSLPGGIFCGGGGTQVCSRDFAAGSTAFLVVDDASASAFRGWGDGCANITTNPHRCEVSLEVDRSIDVFFEPPDGTFSNLNIDVIGAGNVVAVEPSGIDCYDDPTSSDCTEAYPTGQRVRLGIFEQPGETFQGWGGACAEWFTAATIRVTVDADITCTAQFTGVGFTPQFRLDTAMTVDGAPPAEGVVPGQIDSAPVGAGCGGASDDCTADFPMNTSVQLLARPAPQYRFDSWVSSVPGTGCDGATSDSVTVVMSRDIVCTANYRFISADTVLLTTDTTISQAVPPPTGPFGGTITSAPVGIACGDNGNDCRETYQRGSQVTLTATPSPGYRFQTWNSDCGFMPATVVLTLDADLRCTANFLPTAPPPTAMLNVIVVGEGRVDSTPAGVNCGSDCSEDFPLNSVINLVASAVSGNEFVGWTGDCSGGTSIQVDMNQDRTCTANFAPSATTSRLTIAVIGNGTVTSTDGGINCPGDCSEDYPTGSSASIVATPAPGERLISWIGICAEFGGTSLTVPMSQDWSCTATFGP